MFTASLTIMDLDFASAGDAATQLINCAAGAARPIWVETTHQHTGKRESVIIPDFPVFDPATLSTEDLERACQELRERGAVVVIYDAKEFATRFDGADGSAVADWFNGEKDAVEAHLHEVAYAYYQNNGGPQPDDAEDEEGE